LRMKRWVNTWVWPSRLPRRGIRVWRLVCCLPPLWCPHLGVVQTPCHGRRLSGPW